MAVRAPRPTPTGQTSARSDGLRVTPVAPRRNLPLMSLGALVVVFFSLVFALAWLRAGDRRPVLVVARPVGLGASISDGDLRVVRVGADEGVQTVSASERHRVLGRPAAVPLVPGALLTRAHVGSPTVVRSGEALVAVALKPGQLPPNLARGATVRIVDVGGGAGGGPTGTPASAPGVVVAVAEPEAAGSALTVVTVKVTDDAADRVAAWSTAGRAAVVVTPP